MNMLRRSLLQVTLSAGCGLVLAGMVHLASPVSAATTWDTTAAAKHMDERQTWWMNWPKAKRDHGTSCVSCHTALPYAMARTSLREMMGVKTEAPPEQEMLGYVTKRVNNWAEMEPFYGEKSGPRKPEESRVAEAVLNALILARYDSVNGTMSPTTKTAFDNMWALQFTTGEAAGGWEWLNFHYAPWEGDTSAYYGATLATLAVGYTPDSYKKSPEIQRNLTLLRGYLQTNYDAQPLLNKTLLLWSSARFLGLLTKEQKTALVAEIESHQEKDGGWSLATLGSWKRRDNTAIDTRTDGYATAISILALKSAGLANKASQIKQGVGWLVANQDATGMWMASSLNKQRPPESDPALFMSDSATGFAVLALQATR
jgi:hypothetical protein